MTDRSTRFPARWQRRVRPIFVEHWSNNRTCWNQEALVIEAWFKILLYQVEEGQQYLRRVGAGDNKAGNDSMSWLGWYSRMGHSPYAQNGIVESLCPMVVTMMLIGQKSSLKGAKWGVSLYHLLRWCKVVHPIYGIYIPF